jgi:membrane-associated protease RseP (regulator of RpoE activity)
MSEQVTVYVRAGDPASEAALRHLAQRGIEPRVRDVVTDPSASAVLLSRVGRVAVPTFQIGDRLLVGFDPVQLARFLPRDEADQTRVSFGAAVRTVTPAIAGERGLPASFGVEVGQVRDGSPAAEAGVRPGDVITAIGAYTLTGGDTQFRTAVGARRPGDTMTITVWRGGETEAREVRFPEVEEDQPAPSPDESVRPA